MNAAHNRHLLELVLAIMGTIALGPGSPLASASARGASPPEVRRPVSIDDLLSLRNGFDAEIAPSGSQVAFAIVEPSKDYSSSVAPVTNLWLVSTNGEQPVTRFTAGTHMDWSPHWSPDSERIAFLSSRTGNTRVYVKAAVGTGVTIAVTPAQIDVSDFAWAPDGKRIAFVAADASQAADYNEHSFAAADEIVISRKTGAARLFVLDLMTKALRPLSDPKVSVEGFAWSPGGDRIAVQVRDLSKSRLANEPSNSRLTLATVPAHNGELSTIAELRGAVGTMHWSPDGSQIAMLAHESNGHTKFMRTLVSFAVAGGTAPRRLLGDYAGSISEFAWTADSRRIVFVGAEGVKNCVRTVDAVSGAISRPLRDSAIEGLSVSRGTRTRIAFFDESPLNPRDIWVTALDGAARQLTHLNPHIRALSLAKAEIVNWVADDGVPIEGILLKPASSDHHAPYPLVIMPHGGITGWGRWKLGFLTDVGQVMAANYGYAVLYPNPRGTPGYGAFFEDELDNDVGGRELQDILDGIDYLVKEGVADTNRLAIGGWSWGGTLAAWAVTRTDRFRCAVDGGGVVDWASFFGQTDSPVIALRLFGGTPYKRGDFYRERSTISHVESIHTPLLVLHGEMDTHVPAGQAWEIYRALNVQGKDVEFVIYPREHEYLVEPAHARNFMNRVLEWYERHLKDSATERATTVPSTPTSATAQQR